MRFALLFRGINVGGKNAVAMAELRQTLADAGFTRVTTYLQSGNALVSTPETQTSVVAARVQSAFLERFGFSVGVVVLSQAELQRAVEGIPFTPAELAAAEAADPAVDHLYLYFLPDAPETAALERLTADAANGDRVFAAERTVYLMCEQSIRKSKAAARIARLFPAATARNGKTARQVYALLRETEF